MRGRGRPTKLNKRVQEHIVKMIKLGNYLETAAAFAGLDVSTVRRWINRGKAELERLEVDNVREIREREQIYVEFAQQVEHALAVAEVKDVQVIYNAAKNDYRAAVWRLERRFTGNWVI
ncbi:hypothetical protein [Alkaliphilus transvaalensis]|uniref:hypothetical protein n=1 Tax=Alkaliphilus transvaalensis TaxID=114628 RepID=UPI0006882D7C|nr:hypothetical protein [Alkaliphilus transvaalensis]